MHTKLAIEKLKLEPKIIYSQSFDNWERDYGGTKKVEDLRLHIAEKITLAECKHREQKKQQLEMQLSVKQDKFKEMHKSHLSLIEKAEYEFVKQLRENQNVSFSSLSSHHSFFTKNNNDWFSENHPESFKVNSIDELNLTIRLTDQGGSGSSSNNLINELFNNIELVIGRDNITSYQIDHLALTLVLIDSVTKDNLVEFLNKKGFKLNKKLSHQLNI